MNDVVKKYEKDVETASKEENIFDKDTRRCQICGCTQNNACPGGCYWIRNDLCSRCYEEFYEKGEFQIGDLVKVTVTDATCGMTLEGVYTGVVMEHLEVGLCIAFHDMELIKANEKSIYYPNVLMAENWSSYEVELFYRETRKMNKEVAYTNPCRDKE